MSYSRFVLIVVTGMLGLCVPTSSRAEPFTEKSAAQILPSSTTLYTETLRPSEMIDLVLNHPLRTRIESSDAYQKATEGEGMAKLRMGIAMFEAGMEQPWQEAITSLTQGGMYVGYDSNTKGVVVLSKADSRETLDKFRAFVQVVGRVARKGGGEATEYGTYRKVVTLDVAPQVKMAFLENWLVVTNRPELGKQVIDNALDGAESSLAETLSFQEAKQNRAESQVWGYVNVETIRDAGIAERLYSGRTDNILAEVLFGGLLSNLQQTPYATASLNLQQDRVNLELATSNQMAWLEGRAYYFGESGKAKAPPLLNPPGTIAAISAYRDLSQMWLRSGDLLTEKGSEDLAKADSTLTTFFSGKDFGEDILGAFASDVQLVVVAQDFEKIVPTPAIKLPAFAFQFELKDREATQGELRRVFQSFVGFVNIIGAMQGQPQLDLGSDTSDEAAQYYATFVPNADAPDDKSASVQYNFSPTLGFVSNRMIMASSLSLARTLIDGKEADKAAFERPAIKANSLIHINAKQIATALEPNREYLIAQNMLEKGHGHEAAEAEIGVLFEIIELVSDVTVSLENTESELKLNTQLRLNLEAKE